LQEKKTSSAKAIVRGMLENRRARIDALNNFITITLIYLSKNSN